VQRVSANAGGPQNAHELGISGLAATTAAIERSRRVSEGQGLVM